MIETFLALALAVAAIAIGILWRLLHDAREERDEAIRSRDRLHDATVGRWNDASKVIAAYEQLGHTIATGKEQQ